MTACHKDIIITLIDEGFTVKQLLLVEYLVLSAHNVNYSDIIAKGSLELFEGGGGVE